VPTALAEEAAAITTSRIPWDHAEPHRSERRRAGYFWAVLRKRALRSRDRELQALRARFALASVVQDLRAAGFDEHTVRARLESEYSDEIAVAGVVPRQLDLAG
jgi:hypothetical protein